MPHPNPPFANKALTLASLMLTLTLSACNTQPLITSTTEGTLSAAPVERISGAVATTTTDLSLNQSGSVTQAVITQPSTTTSTTTSYANFVLPLATPPDSALTRFNALFAPSDTCKLDLTGNYLARLSIVDTLTSANTPFISQLNTMTSGFLSKTQRVMYFYSDRQTYLYGFVHCTDKTTNTKRDTGFDLNLLPGWNRVVLTESYADDSKSSYYAVSTRTTGNTTTLELWQAAPSVTSN